MKKTLILLISLFLMNYSIKSNSEVTEINLRSTDSIRVLCTPDLNNLTEKWISEYNKLFPETKISIIMISDEKSADNLMSKGFRGFVSNEYYTGLNIESIWKIVIGRDVIVPIINSNNPFLDEIDKKGISPANLSIFLTSKDSMKWGTLLDGKQNVPAVFYSINDKSISKGISEFLKTDMIKDAGIKVDNPDELISEIKKNPYAIGFCKITDITDLNNRALAENITLLPIDRNGNGIIDYNEKIYNDFNDFQRGVWIGKYPKSLVSNIYYASSKRPENESEINFLKWVLTGGQQYLYSNGYSDLLISERQSTVDKINEALVYSSAATDNRSLIKAVIVIFVVLVLAGLAFDYALKYIRRRKSEFQTDSSVERHTLDENSLILPKGIYFDKTHTWAYMEQNGVVKVGIDDFIQHITGALTRIKMKNEGYQIKKGEHILSIIQSGKQLNIYAPISGIIIEKNSALNTNASILNSSPYNDGWIYRIEPTNWQRENQLLFMAEKHRQFIKNEFSRLKDFLAGIIDGNNEKYAQIILQDGGELIDNTLSNLGPEVWEDFQLNFIDPSRQIWFYELF